MRQSGGNPDGRSWIRLVILAVIAGIAFIVFRLLKWL